MKRATGNRDIDSFSIIIVTHKLRDHPDPPPFQEQPSQQIAEILSGAANASSVNIAAAPPQA